MSLNYATRAIAQIVGAPSPALSGTSLTVTAGQGARFINGAQERRARLYDVTTGAVEHVTITGRSTDTFTVVRNVDAGGAQAIASTGWVLEDIDDLGPWHNVAFDPGFFGAFGGGTWVVDPADVITHRWRRVGFTIEYEVVVTNSSITGTVTHLGVYIPSAAASAVYYQHGPHPCMIFDNSPSVGQLGFYNILNGTNQVLIIKANGAALTASVNLTSIAFFVKAGIA